MRECQQYEIKLPYPEVTGGNDPFTVELLKEDYAGIVSEMTALCQYMFQHLLLTENGYSFARELECIAITEMRHKDLLGTAIVRLGGTPIFATTNTFWCANYVDYVEDPKRMILSDIKGEYAAIYNYRCHIQLTPNASVKRLLERIILDEEMHIRLFNEMLSALQ